MKIIKVRHEALVDTVPPQLKEKMVFKIKNYISDHEVIVKDYRETPEGVWIPRAIMPTLIDHLEDAQWSPVTIDFKGQLKSYQYDLVNSFLQSKRNGVISAGTGSGKTVMGLYIAHKIGLKTLIIVPTERIFHQWIQRCQTFCGFTPSMIRGHLCEFDKPITVAMLQTLAIGTRINKQSLYTQFGFTIYDEVHRLPTEKFAVVARMFWDKYRLGLSATPTRKDGLHNIFFNHIGQVVAKYYFSQVIPKVILVKYVDYQTIPQGSCMRGGKLSTARYLNQLMAIPNRNKLIAYYIYHAYKKNRKILMLTDRLNHIDTVTTLLTKLKISREEIGLITGTVKEVGKPILLATYGSAGMGLDIPELDFLILATPRADIRQAVGRVLRPKNTVPIIVDIVDNSSEIMRKYSQIRTGFYRRIGCTPTEAYINSEVVYDKFQKLLETS